VVYSDKTGEDYYRIATTLFEYLSPVFRLRLSCGNRAYTFALAVEIGTTEELLPPCPMVQVAVRALSTVKKARVNQTKVSPQRKSDILALQFCTGLSSPFSFVSVAFLKTFFNI
jgi:hypothetical protein